MIDFPTYSLENSTLKSTVHFDADPSSRLVLGKGYGLSGDMGGGAASGLYSVKGLPHTVGDYSGINVTILNIQRDNVTLDLSGRRMVLESGESWRRERTDTVQIYDSLMNVTDTLTIWNHGMVDILSPKSGQEGRSADN